MNIEQFKEQYVNFKDVDKIQIMCDCPTHEPKGELLTLGKQPAKRNILKNNGEKFICKTCCLKNNNPMHRTGPIEKRQTDEEIDVVCPHPDHQSDPIRKMKKACYYGSMNEPYMQICKSCSQLGRIVTEEMKERIRIALTGIERSEEFKEKQRQYMKNNPERLEQAIKTLLDNHCSTGMLGKHHTDEHKKHMSDLMSGRVYTEEHKQNISVGRKKMLEETGGFSVEHRRKLSEATLNQYQNGFEPKLHHVSGWHNSPKAGRVFHRSSYEKKAFLKLDEDEQVKTYNVEKISVPYFNAKKENESYYLVDLEVIYEDDSIRLIEVKPAKWLNDEIVKSKLEAGVKYAEERNISFQIWTELELFGAVYNQKHIQNFVDNLREELKL